MDNGETLVEAALEVLKTPDPVQKARLGEKVAIRWLDGTIKLPYHYHHNLPPDRPARLCNVKLLPPQQMPKLGKGGSLQSRQAILHSLVHIESWAIDLSWDIIARFGRQESMPREFFTDFVKVAEDEGRHFSLLVARLEELGSFYGAFPAHDGLWDSAIETSNNLLARLAVEHCVHEARGLDVLPTTISRFRDGGDEKTAKLLETVVYPEEITHCAAGIRWFSYLCLRTSRRYGCADLVLTSVKPQISSTVEIISDRLTEDRSVESGEESLRSSVIAGDDQHEIVIQTFHATVKRYFRGPLKPPFNAEARKAAGFGPDWYEPLAVKEVKICK
ncbi:uncharacterized protein [Typha angustifolia]|uniref:uncharacterized protein isoform X1 n=1 Tax=Typha angustifolia TaxID=59011 RepID=UPI003C2E3D43